MGTVMGLGSMLVDTIDIIGRYGLPTVAAGTRFY